MPSVKFANSIAQLGGTITGATANDTMEAVTDLSTSDTYTDAAVNAKIAIIENNFADLQAKVNEIIVALGDN